MEVPSYCQYCQDKCDQVFLDDRCFKAFFVHPSHPRHLALTVLKAVRELKNHSSADSWQSWEDLGIGGQIIFCKICQAMRQAETVIANITNLNFNVLFELGYAIGLRKPVVPIRDTSYKHDYKAFEWLGILDAMGYENFQNSKNVVSIAMKGNRVPVIGTKSIKINKEQPIYYIKSPVNTDGSIKLSASLKKSAFRFRTFDWREVPRLSLHEAYRQVQSSMSVVAHLIDPEREGAETHNALAAFVSGMAMASGKRVLMFQEGAIVQPIDYRDIVIPYTDISTIPTHIEKLVRATADTALSIANKDVPVPKELLEKVDLGDVAAENEIQALSRYFVKTVQYRQAIQGHARLVVGRKGSGKTAIFYAVYETLSHNIGILCLDLKPEGHQFIKLKEMVLTHMSEGVQLHTLTAFWNYLLLLEIAKKVVQAEIKNAYKDPDSLTKYEELVEVYRKHVDGEEDDFSERLMRLVNRLIDIFVKDGKKSNFTELIYKNDIKELSTAVIEYLAKYEQAWLLFDNLDKGWPTHGATTQDTYILRCLLEAARKLERSLQRKDVDFRCVVFLRKDIYDLLVKRTPDRGKEPVANLDWSDEVLLKELLRSRFIETEELEGTFEQIWRKLFDPHVGGEDSFRYILSRTLLRPRDVLNYVRKCINTAISRNHQRVEEEDVLAAEIEFSEDMLNDVHYEIVDVFSEYTNVVHKFVQQNQLLSKDDISLILMEAGVDSGKIEKVIDLLLWFSFLGISYQDKDKYSYQLMYNLEKLKSFIKTEDSSAICYTIHPAFRKALEINDCRL